jgi:dCMP deaminase
MSRISRIEYGLLIAKISSLRSEDPHTKVGCAIENKNGRIISIGYNGLKEKQTLHFSASENRDKKRDFFIHAETNALSLIKKGDAETIYLTHSPCVSCCHNIAAHGINNVFFLYEYNIDYKEILKSYEINFNHYVEINDAVLYNIINNKE